MHPQNGGDSSHMWRITVNVLNTLAGSVQVVDLHLEGWWGLTISWYVTKCWWFLVNTVINVQILKMPNFWTS
jgi:hypothetical protein